MSHARIVGTEVQVKSDLLDQVRANTKLSWHVRRQLAHEYAGVPGQTVRVEEIISDHRRPPSLDPARTLFGCLFGDRVLTLTDKALAL